MRVDSSELFRGGFGLGSGHVACLIENLPLEVAGSDLIRIYNAYPAYPGSCEIHQHR